MKHIQKHKISTSVVKTEKDSVIENNAKDFDGFKAPEPGPWQSRLGPGYKYPDDHPFAIFEGNYIGIIKWSNITSTDTVASTLDLSPEELEKKITAYTRSSVKAYKKAIKEKN